MLITLTSPLGCDDEPSPSSRVDAGEPGDTDVAETDGVEVPDPDLASDIEEPDHPPPDASADAADPLEDVGDPADTDVAHDCFAPGTLGWHTCGGWIHDPQGRRVLLRGVNVTNARKHPPYEGGTSDQDFEAMRRLGLNHIRLLWSWAAAMPERGTLDTAYLDRVAGEVARANSHGLLIVLDAHQDLFGEAIRTESGPVGNGAPVWACPEEIAGTFTEAASPWFVNYAHPAVQGCFDHLYGDVQLQDLFAEAWGALAGRVRDVPGLVGYDLWNEPYWGTSNLFDWEADALLPLYERLGTAILAADPDALLFVEPGLQKNVLGTSTLPRPDFPEIVYAPHLYDPQMESGEPWGGSLRSFETRLVNDRAEAASWDDAPIHLGEWGTPGTHENDAQFVAAVVSLLDDATIGFAVWQWGPGGPGSYALVDADFEPHSFSLELARPYPERIAGDDLEFGVDSETGSFSAGWTAHRIDTASIIVVPPLSAHASAEVTVDGGRRLDTSAPDRLEIMAETIGSRVELTLTPR